jgi:hypothetical protein
VFKIIFAYAFKLIFFKVFSNGFDALVLKLKKLFSNKKLF